jgi:O-acetyl-ADP-ribose deacetylase (regulator of RNase III)
VQIASFLDDRLQVKVGDLTLEATDAIVNAANSGLLGGGGVDGAIHRRGGPQILETCREIRRTRYQQGLPVGQAVMTTAGALSARYVIHTVGPIYGEHDGEEAGLLANCYRNSLQLAQREGLSSIAFPAISTGIYGYPKHEAARVAYLSVRDHLLSVRPLESVRLVFFSRADAEIFLAHGPE